jgi:hypothetical protein
MVSPLHSASMPPLHSSSSSLDGGAGGNMDPSSLHSALSVASAMGGVSHGFSTPFSTSRLTQQVNQSIAEENTSKNIIILSFQSASCTIMFCI